MAPRSPHKLALQLPPELDDSSPTESGKSSVQSLLPRALDKLSKLGPVENLKLRNVVGRGGTSSVRLLKRRGTQDVYVAKVFNTLHQEQSELLCAELRALVVMDCPCVVGFHGAWEHDNFVYVVLEAMWLGSLLDVMRNGEQPLFHHPEDVGCGRGRSQVETEMATDDNDTGNHGNDDEDNERVMLAISFQVLWGLNYMHSIGLVHGDIKSSNVLVSTCGSVKLADFGTSTFDPGAGSNIAGTFRYMPPERMDEGKFGPEGDVWAAGMMVAELIAKRVPFASCNTHVEMMEQLLANDDDAIVEHVLPKSAGAPESVANLVKGCLVMDPAKRPTAKKLLLSPAFAAHGLRTPKDAQMILESWMRGDPNEAHEPLFCCDEDDDDDDFDDDEYDDSGMFNEGFNYQSDALLSSPDRFRVRAGGMSNSAANLLRSASLLAMPTRNKGFVRSSANNEDVHQSWPRKHLNENGDNNSRIFSAQAVRTLSMPALLAPRGKPPARRSSGTTRDQPICASDNSPLQLSSPKHHAVSPRAALVPVSADCCPAWLEEGDSSPCPPFHGLQSVWSSSSEGSLRSQF